MSRQLRVAVVGAGPAGIYAADILTKADLPPTFDRSRRPHRARPDAVRAHPLRRRARPPAHQGDRQGAQARAVQPGHPLLRQRLLRRRPQARRPPAVLRRRHLRHRRPQRPRPRHPGHRPQGLVRRRRLRRLVRRPPRRRRATGRSSRDATSVAVLGVGNVGLDVARILAKTAEELLVTEIPDNVADGLRRNATTDVHVFARRGPAQVKFTPMELRELNHSPNIDVVVHPEGFELDEGSMDAIRASKSVKLVVDVLQNYLGQGAVRRRPPHPHPLLPEPRRGARRGRPGRRACAPRSPSSTAPATCAAPASSSTGPSRRSTARSATTPTTSPACRSTSPPAWCPTTAAASSTSTAPPLPGAYVTGLDQARAGRPHRPHQVRRRPDRRAAARGPRRARRRPPQPEREAVDAYLAGRGLEVTTWEGWEKLDAHELALGEAHDHARRARQGRPARRDGAHRAVIGPSGRIKA